MPEEFFSDEWRKRRPAEEPTPDKEPETAEEKEKRLSSDIQTTKADLQIAVNNIPKDEYGRPKEPQTRAEYFGSGSSGFSSEEEANAATYTPIEYTEPTPWEIVDDLRASLTKFEKELKAITKPPPPLTEEQAQALQANLREEAQKRNEQLAARQKQIEAEAKAAEREQKKAAADQEKNPKFYKVQEELAQVKSQLNRDNSLLNSDRKDLVEHQKKITSNTLTGDQTSKINLLKQRVTELNNKTDIKAANKVLEAAEQFLNGRSSAYSFRVACSQHSEYKDKGIFNRRYTSELIALVQEIETFAPTIDKIRIKQESTNSAHELYGKIESRTHKIEELRSKKTTLEATFQQETAARTERNQSSDKSPQSQPPPDEEPEEGVRPTHP